MPEELCRTCKDPVSIQIMKNTGLCSEICRKLDAGEISAEEWIARREARDGRREPHASAG